MNALFFLICSVSVVFFVVFLFECSRPLRKSKKGTVVRRLTEGAAIDSATGRRFFAHIDQQMAEFLSADRRTVALFVLAVFLLSTAYRARAEGGGGGGGGWSESYHPI